MRSSFLFMFAVSFSFLAAGPTFAQQNNSSGAPREENWFIRIIDEPPTPTPDPLPNISDDEIEREEEENQTPELRTDSWRGGWNTCDCSLGVGGIGTGGTR